MQTFGDATGTATMDEIKAAGGEDNVLQDATEESSNSAAISEEGSGGDTGEEREGELPPGDDATVITSPGDVDTRASIADELGYDPANLTPKQAAIIDEVLAQLGDSAAPAPATSDAHLTDIEKEVRAQRAAASVAATTMHPVTPAQQQRMPQPPRDDNPDPISLDPAQHYTAEAQLYSDSMDQRLSEAQRRRAFDELREHRRYEFAKDLVFNLKSPVVLNYLREQLLQDVAPKLEQFDNLNRSATQYRSRQAAERNAMIQLSKLEKTDPDIAEFVKASDGRPSAYQRVLSSDPRIAARVNRLGENPEYADLPADRRAVLHEIDRIRLAHDLAPRDAKPSANAQSRVSKVKAATALVKKGATVSSAAAKAAASIIAKRTAGAANGGNTAPANGQRRFANPDAERLRIAANKSSGIFG